MKNTTKRTNKTTKRDKDGIIRMIETPIDTTLTETPKTETPTETKPTYQWIYPKEFKGDEFLKEILGDRETFNPSNDDEMIKIGMMISMGLLTITDERIKQGFKGYTWNKYFEFLIRPMKRKGLLPETTTKLLLPKERILELKNQ